MRFIPKSWIGSLGARLLSAYVLAWLATAIVFGAVGMWALQGGNLLLKHGIDKTLDQLSQYLDYNAQGQPYMKPLPGNMQWIFRSAPLDASYRVFDAQGNTWLWSSDTTRQLWEANHISTDTSSTAHTVVIDGVSLRMASTQLPDNGPQTLWLQVAVSERLARMRHDELSTAFVSSIGFAVLVSILLLGLVLGWGVRKIVAPIHKASQEAQNIQPNGPWKSLHTDGLPNEVLPLVQSFNQALKRLEHGFERQQRFLADAAHELKTPLALLRANIELGETDPAVLLHELDHLTRQVQQLLLWAEVSELRSYQLDDIHADVVIADVLRFLTPLSTKHHVQLELAYHDPSTPLHADRSALFVLLKNLVENAIHVAPTGSVVTVELDAHAIRVRDQGPGIPAPYLGRVFERFWRVPGSREGGAGLGLSICHEIATAHGWSLSARNLQPGAEFVLQWSAPTAVPVDPNHHP
ncbi:hypothetical protein KIK84_06135 [Curvibacter sp. CHRR-16]|uniref:sensor histidine kinase n=1 Tax=Curvibacter sp. CHRR-16 TaxID=2835872 RepID=UPI001BDAF038|nr:ATP-binding protein [Curvibacter sp. CHRR-16]MBT0569898.1 hypothetical protein [Curvibacter sp. CHRR-16]